MKEELERSGLYGNAIVDLMGRYILVNKKDLQALVALHAQQWPQVPTATEIHERILLRHFGKVGVDDKTTQE